MHNAIKFGYKFEIIEGYTFNKANVFNNYVDSLYKLRLEFPKSDPLNLIAKLLLNSLYGKFGMIDRFIKTLIINKKDYVKFEKNHKKDITEVTDMEYSYIVQLVNKSSVLNTTLDNGSEIHNVNVAIASAITAYARIHMTQVKNIPGLKLFYTDTDSAYTNKPLPNHLISDTKLGLFKLERICKNAVFLAPKVYGLVEENGNEIIKVKGLNSKSLSNINITDLKALLIKDSNMEFNQDKWFKHMEKGEITINNQIYTLKVTANKRKLIGLRPTIIMD